MLFSTAKSLLSGFDNKSLFLLKLDILFVADQLARTLRYLSYNVIIYLSMVKSCYLPIVKSVYVASRRKSKYSENVQIVHNGSRVLPLCLLNKN